MDKKIYQIDNFRLPKGFLYQLLYITILPAFFICFNLVYTPLGIEAFYDKVGGKSFDFHMLMLICIMLGSLFITRLIFTPIYKRNRFGLIYYIIWCVGETIIITLFMALYTCLFFKGQMHYFRAVSYCFKFNSLTLLYPYTLLILLRIIINRNQDLIEKEHPTEESMVRFYDEHKRLKLTIASGSILFIEAESNYIKISYIDQEKVKEFTIRNSMKSIAENAKQYGLIRCHRSYYISPKHIKLLKRDKDGFIVAEMLYEGIKAIPVSKQYYNELADGL